MLKQRIVTEWNFVSLEEIIYLEFQYTIRSEWLQIRLFLYASFLTKVMIGNPWLIWIEDMHSLAIYPLKTCKTMNSIIANVCETILLEDKIGECILFTSSVALSHPGWLFRRKITIRTYWKSKSFGMPNLGISNDGELCIVSWYLPMHWAAEQKTFTSIGN